MIGGVVVGAAETVVTATKEVAKEIGKESTKEIVGRGPNITELKELTKETTVIERKEPNILELKEEKSMTITPEKNGEWSGERGNSKWKPERDKIPEKSNPDGKNYGEILDEYGIESIEFDDGEPNFKEVSKGTVEIDNFTSDRRINFAQADEKMAKEMGMTPQEFVNYRKENKYTWHERKDCKTMDLVPSIIHNNIVHSGGISEKKKEMLGG